MGRTMPFDAPAQQPQRSRVYRQVLQAIRSGTLAPGQRLQSARRLAADWAVARGAVDSALAQLAQEGLIERRVGAGSFVVNPLPPGTRLAGQPAAAAGLQPPPAKAGSTGVPAAAPGMLLHPLLTDTASFPLAAWRRHVARSFDDADRACLSYGAPAGLAALREATARYLRLTRAIDCAPKQVMIVNSALHALELIVQVLLEPGDAVCVEDPGFAAVARVLTQAHLRVVAVPVDAQGFDVAAAQRLAPGAAALYLHPLNQYPLGWRTSAARRQALLDLAGREGAWIIEGDNLAEIVHDGAAPPALWRSDRAERVLYVGTFNGVTFPSLRLAYLVVPERLVPVFAAVRGMMGDHSALAPQTALAGFIASGQLSSHLRALRALYGQRRLAFISAVQRHLGGLGTLGPTQAGIHACLHLPPDLSDQACLPALAAAGIAAQAVSALCLRPQGLNGLVLGYGAQDAAATDLALAQLAAQLAAHLAAQPAAHLARRPLAGSAEAPA